MRIKSMRDVFFAQDTSGQMHAIATILCPHCGVELEQVSLSCGAGAVLCTQCKGEIELLMVECRWGHNDDGDDGNGLPGPGQDAA